MPLNRCTIHHAVEVLPQVWIKDQFVATGHSHLVEFREVACPSCVQIARASLDELLQNRYITLVTPEALA